MILDEVDQLDSKNQEVLYTMFEWPALENSRLLLIGNFSEVLNVNDVNLHTEHRCVMKTSYTSSPLCGLNNSDTIQVFHVRNELEMSLILQELPMHWT